MPSSTSAKMTVWGCRPPHGKTSAISARLGRARPTLEALIARNEPLPAWASHSAGGSASTIAITSEMTETSRCSSRRCTTAVWLSTMKFRTPLIASPPRSGGPPRPRRDRPLHAEQREVRDHGQGDRQHRAEQYLGHEELREALGDEGAEIVDVYGRGDGDQADRGDGGDPQPGDDHWQGPWEVDLEQHLPWREAHADRGFAHVPRHAVQPRHDVPDQDQQGVADQGDLRGGLGPAGDGDQHSEQRKAGNRVEDAGDRRDEPVHATPADHQQREDQRDGEAEADRDGGELDVLEQPRRDVVHMVPDPGPVDQGALADRGDRDAQDDPPRGTSSAAATACTK